jgi:hypothetical protein
MGICIYLFPPVAYSSMVTNKNMKETSITVKSELLESPRELVIAQHRSIIRPRGIYLSPYSDSRPRGIYLSPYSDSRQIEIYPPYNRIRRDRGVSYPNRHNLEKGAIYDPYPSTNRRRPILYRGNCTIIEHTSSRNNGSTIIRRELCY